MTQIEVPRNDDEVVNAETVGLLKMKLSRIHELDKSEEEAYEDYMEFLNTENQKSI